MKATIQEASKKLAALIERAHRGEEIVICRGSRPLVRLAPISREKKTRRPGALRGKLIVGPEFFEPLPENELAV